MKLFFYKKEFIRVSGDLEELQKEHDELVTKYNNKEFKYLCKYKKLEEINKDNEIMINLIKKENEDLKVQIKKVNGQKGNLTKRNNELTKRVEELEKQLEESMSDKYLVRKISSGRKPKGQSMKVKGSSKESAAIKLVKEKC